MLVSLLVLKLCVDCGVFKDTPVEQKFCEVCGRKLSEVQLKEASA